MFDPSSPTSQLDQPWIADPPSALEIIQRQGASVPDPRDHGDPDCGDPDGGDPDGRDLDQLGERIAHLASQIQAATYQLLVMIRVFDANDGWNSGFASCAHWLNWRTGLSLPAAREKVRVARALGDLPQISAAMSAGRISFSKVRAITRVATPDTEAELLTFAEAGTAAHVERLVRAWRRVDRQEEGDDDARRHEARYLSAILDEDGMLVLRGRLSPEAGALLLRALDAAEEQLYGIGDETSNDETSSDETSSDESTSGQRRSDALELLAQSALANDLDPGTRGDRFQVVLHVDAPVLTHGTGQAALQDGQRVSAETSRRLACDSATVEMLHDAHGNTLDVGRRSRTIPTPIRRALDHRDRTCRFPGCQSHHCEAHHIDHWADGGDTKLDNLVLLCRRHHRAVHEEGFHVRWADDQPHFYWPDGRRLEQAPRQPLSTYRGWDLAVQLAEQGAELDPEAAMPSWSGGAVDYQWALEGIRR